MARIDHGVGVRYAISLECSGAKRSAPIFNVARFVKATLQQFVDSRLAGGALNRGNTCVPLGGNFRVGR
jgi:hypothetical protein